MPAVQLRQTTMDPAQRQLLRVALPDAKTDEDRLALQETNTLVEQLMGRNAEPRFRFIQKNAQFVRDLDV
jgi:topoisomerase-4 subunit B